MGSRQNQEERLQQRMETEKRPETEKNMQQNGPTDIGQIAKWDLSDQQVEGLFGPKENRYKDISQLTEAWKKERNVYPGWYILPYNICAELISKTSDGSHNRNTNAYIFRSAIQVHMQTETSDLN